MSDKHKKVEAAGAGTAVPMIKWDESAMLTTYANVCNVIGTREDVTLLFGTNPTFHAGDQDVTVKLSNRILLSPYAAKRMHRLLENVLAQYEARFGKLKIEPSGE